MYIIYYKFKVNYFITLTEAIRKIPTSPNPINTTSNYIIASASFCILQNHRAIRLHHLYTYKLTLLQSIHLSLLLTNPPICIGWRPSDAVLTIYTRDRISFLCPLNHAPFVVVHIPNGKDAYTSFCFVCAHFFHLFFIVVFFKGACGFETARRHERGQMLALLLLYIPI